MENCNINFVKKGDYFVECLENYHIIKLRPFSENIKQYETSFEISAREGIVCVFLPYSCWTENMCISIMKIDDTSNHIEIRGIYGDMINGSSLFVLSTIGEGIKLKNNDRNGWLAE